MAVPLGNGFFPVDLPRARTGCQQHFLRAETHRGALRRALIAHLVAAKRVLPFRNERNDRMRGGAVELGAVRIRQAKHVAPVFDDGHLHAQTDSEIWHALLARELHRLDLAFDAAFAEAAGHENGIHALQHVRAVLLDIRGLDVVDVHARARLEPRVRERLVQRDVRVANLHVLADHRDVDLPVGIRLGAHDLAPFRQIRLWSLEAQLFDDDVIELLLMQKARNLVDVVRIDRRDDGALFDIGEQRNLATLLFRQRMLAANSR